MKNKISVLVLSLCMLAASMTVITDNAFAGTVGIDTSAKEPRILRLHGKTAGNDRT